MLSVEYNYYGDAFVRVEADKKQLIVGVTNRFEVVPFYEPMMLDNKLFFQESSLNFKQFRNKIDGVSYQYLNDIYYFIVLSFYKNSIKYKIFPNVSCIYSRGMNHVKLCNPIDIDIHKHSVKMLMNNF